MKFPVPRSVFAAVEVSEQLEDEIEAKADAVLEQTLQSATRHIEDEDGRVNEHAWKKIKQFDSSVTLYRERKAGTVAARPRSGTFASRNNSLGSTPPPSFLLVGEIMCSLDDLMFGLSTGTSDEQRIRSSYAPDGVLDCQLLHEIHQPTKTTPFNHLNLQWLTMDSGSVPLTHPRDYVVVDGAGLINGSRPGTKIGYALRESVQLDDAHPLDYWKIVRGAMSVCGVFHEITPSVVHVYMRMSFEPRARGAVNKSLATAAAMSFAAALPRMSQVSQMKKLATAVRERERRLSDPTSRDTRSEGGNPLASSYGSNATTVSHSMIRPIDDDSCASCYQFVKASAVSDDESRCALCRQLLCRRCRISKELSFMGRYNRIHKSKATCCSECISRVIHRDASVVAVEALLLDQQLVTQRALYTSMAVCERSTVSFQAWRSRPLKCVDYERLTQTLLRQTVREYERSLDAARFSTKAWKTLRHREGLTVYRARGDTGDAASSPCSFGWSLPKLLLTGAVVGTLDDVMFGTVAPTSEAMRIRATYVEDELLDAELLRAIAVPTAGDPFRFLGLKWAVRSHASPLSPVVWPRDTVVVEATGLHALRGGARVGFRVVHSVQLPQCPELTPLGVVRTRMSSTALFRQLDNGTVDVYMTRFVESSGNLPDSAALLSAAAAMIGCWKSVWCSQNKKLACAAKDGALRWAVDGVGRIERLVTTTDEAGRYCCGLCRRGYKMYSSVTTCQACSLMVCSRCQVGRRLAKINQLNQLTQYPVLFCKNCITRSTHESAFDVASGECTTDEQAARLRDVPRPRGQTASVLPEVSRRRPPKSTASPSRTALSSAYEGKRGASIATNSTFSGSLDGLEPASLSVSDDGEYDDDDVDENNEGENIQTVDDWDRVHDRSFYMERPPRLSASDSTELVRADGSAAPPLASPQRGGTDPEQQHLWRQMSQLCMAAEETYRLTKKNADAMRHQLST